MSKIKTDELDQWHLFGVYTPARLIDLSGTIDEEKAVQFIKNIRLLDHVGSNDILVLINTPGGDVHQGMAIFDAIRECHSKVITHAVGPCWSMGACVLQAGDVRKISQNATLMIHRGKSDLSDEDNDENLERWLKEYKRVGQTYKEALYQKIKKKKPRYTIKQMEKVLLQDTIYTAEKVIEMGLAEFIEEHKSFEE